MPTQLETQPASASASSPRPQALAARFRTVRAATLAFTAPLSPEDLMVQSSPDASPVKWHLAHTSWFFETFVLTPYASGYKAFHPDFHWLFNSYYTSLGDMPAKNLRSSFSRPPLDDILAYRIHVDAAVEHLLSHLPVEHADDILRRIVLGLEHEQQHLELIATDIKHALFTNPLHPAYKASSTDSFSKDSSSPSKQSPLDESYPASLLSSRSAAEGSASATTTESGASGLASETWSDAAQTSTEEPSPLTFTPFPGGLTEIGITPAPHDPEAFAFDNETPRHTVFLQPFALANRLVTTAEYLAFIDDNGYTRPELWLSEGWSIMRREGWQAPLYWQRDSKAQTGWSVFTLTGFRPLESLFDTPVCHLSLFEADAFARWKGMRLPTEFEWEHAAATTQTPPDSSLLSSRSEAEESASVPAPANMLESGSLQPTPAPSSPGLQQIFGDVWEWTSSGYTGYPGYRPLPGALGEYNGKFMSSQVILRGGSCVTPTTHIRATYRNFFPPATRWQFSGLRLARDI